jgi:copper chaperone CopZ
VDVSANKFRLLAIGILMLGAASSAFACGDDKKEASNTSATVASATKAADAKGCCAKGAKAASATVASKDCAAKSGSSSVVLTSTAGGDHCMSGSKSAVASGDCTYGTSSVTMAGACPTKNEADYAFYVAGAECRGTGTAAAKAIKSVKGVASVTVDYENHMVYVCADGKAASKKAIEKSLKTAGYEEVKFVNASKQNCQKSHGKVEA